MTGTAVATETVEDRVRAAWRATPIDERIATASRVLAKPVRELMQMREADLEALWVQSVVSSSAGQPRPPRPQSVPVGLTCEAWHAKAEELQRNGMVPDPSQAVMLGLMIDTLLTLRGIATGIEGLQSQNAAADSKGKGK